METKELKETIDQINREFKAMVDELKGRAAAEEQKFGQRLGDTVAKLDAINGRIDALEVKLQRPAAGDRRLADVMDPVRTKAFATFLRKGVSALTPDERKLMTIVDDTTGGFGATEEFDREIIKAVTEISPVRQLVRVRTTGARSFKFMKRTGQFAAKRTNEVDTRTETTGYKYGLEDIPVYELYAMVDIARQDLEDTGFDLEGELKLEFTEQFAKKEGTEFVSGDAGLGQMEGLLNNAAITQDVTGDANNLTYSGLVDVSHNGKEGYDWRFIFNRKTLGKLRLMVDGTGSPLWVAMAAGAPATVLGLPYVIVPDLDSVAANKFPVFCGDFKRGYVMGDRTQQVIVRDDVTQLTKGAVRFYAYKRNGGQVVLAEAIRKLKISV